MSETGEPRGLSHASTRRARRLSVIWLVPLVAVAIGVWLAWDTLSKEGPTITISFETAEGLTAGQSQLKFRDIMLGTVKSLTLSPDHTHVVVTVSTTRQAVPLLTTETQFWVVKPRLFAGNLSGLSTLVSGSYIGMLPGKGSSKHDFVGREDPPVLVSDIPGHTFLLKATRLGSVTLGSPVYFRDLEVGEVLGWDIGDMASSVTIHVFVRAPYDKYVFDQTRFWDASGLSVKLGSGGIDVQVESLRALLLGGIAYDSLPGTAQGKPSDVDHQFPLFANKEAAQAASYARKIPLVAYFSGSVRGLGVGAEVTVHGLKVGQVTDVKLVYSAAKDAILAPVHFEVEPERFLGLGRQLVQNTEQAVQMMVDRGARATLQSANLLTGQMLVSIDFISDSPPAKVTMEDGSYLIPTADSGGFSGLEASATELLRKVNSIPFDSLGKNLNDLSAGLNNMVNGPDLKQILTSLKTTLVSVQTTVQNLDAGLSPAMKKLPDIATGLQKTVADANKLVLSVQTGYGDNTQFNRDLDHLLIQLSDAARSVRALADLLSRHPEALIKGRPTGGIE